MYNDEKKKESVRLSLAKQKMGKFEKDAKTLLDAIGGKENVSAVSHCATRMRFVLADEKKADVKAIEAIPAVKGTFTNAGQFQVIIGNDVPIFYNDFTAVSAGFVTIMIMIVGYSIPDGIAAGFIVYVVSKIFTKNVKDITPSVWAMFVLFVLHFALK